MVAALLERAKSEETFEAADTNRFFSGLKHPDLAKQLWDYIKDPALNVIVRRLAIEIARDCKLQELTTEFLGLLSTEANPTIRDHLAHALEQITPPDRAADLIPLAKGEIGPDADDTLKGCALRVLIPKVWSVSDALPFLRAANENFYGAYKDVLSNHIPKHIQPGDLKPILGRILEWGDCFDSLSAFYEIAEKTMAEAIRRLNDPEIARAAVEVWRQKSRQHCHFGAEQNSEVRMLLERDRSLRLGFVEEILNSPDTTEHDLYLLPGRGVNLLVQEDLSVLLQKIGHVSSERRRVWAIAISFLARPAAAKFCWDLLLDRIEAIPELKQRFSWLRAYNLDEPEAQQQKAIWLEEKQQRENWENRKRNAPSPETLVQRDLDEIQAGNVFWWMRLCKDLGLKEGDTHYRSLEYDLTESPGWLAANEQRQKEIIGAARQFLLCHNDGYAEKAARTNYSDPGYLAIGLLRDRITLDSDLRTAVAEKWIDAITGRFSNGQKYHQDMIALAYELNPDRCVQGFHREVLDDDRLHGHILALASYRVCWDARLTKELMGLINSGQLKPTSIESSLSFLAETDPEATVECVRLLLPPGIETLEAQKARTKGVVCVSFAKLTNATWDVVWPLIEAHNDFAEDVLQKIAYGVDYSSKTLVLPPTSEHQLADVYSLLNRVFPPEMDQPFTAGEVTPRNSIPQLRANLIQALTARGNDAACNELLRLSSSIPPQRIWLRWRYWEALRLKRRDSWQPVSPQTVRSLLENPAARIVEDEADLLEGILESLARFQIRLTKSAGQDSLFLLPSCFAKRGIQNSSLTPIRRRCSNRSITGNKLFRPRPLRPPAAFFEATVVSNHYFGR